MSNGIIRRIVTLAERLEPDREVIWDWLFHTQIETLGGHTAMELIFAYRGEQVITLLETALREEEGRTFFSDRPTPRPHLHRSPPMS
ncbi:MAG: hypothetical protein ACREPQ_08215 [Rhodanobacter sp.]